MVTVDPIKTKRIGPKLSEKLKAGIKDVNLLAASKPEKIAKARMRVPKFWRCPPKIRKECLLSTISGENLRLYKAVFKPE